MTAPGDVGSAGRPSSAEPESAASTPALEVLRFVFGYWRRVPVRFAVMVVGVVVGIGIEIQIPRLSADLVVVTERHLAGALDAGVAWRAAGWLVAAFASVSLVKQLYLRNWMHLASQVMQRLVADGFRRVQRFSYEWHTNHFAGSTQREVTRGMWAYDVLADTLVIDLGPALGLLIGLTGAMLLRDPILGAYFGVSVTLFVVTSVLMSLRYVSPANVLANESDSLVGGALADAITCNAVVKSFGAEEREDARFERASMAWRFRALRAWSRSMDAGAVQSVLLLLLLAGLLGLVLFRPGATQQKIEDAVYVITTYLVVHSYMRNIGHQVRNVQRAINELDDLVSFAKLVPQVRDVPDARVFRPGDGTIRFESVSFGYSNRPGRLFDRLSVEIRAGEKVALVGESGAGKSTFARLIQRLYDVDSGRVLVDGQDISLVEQDSLRRSISVVPQEPTLFHRSLAENIAYGRPEATHEQIVAAARLAHAHEFIAQLDAGYDTLVGERGIKLSGGERQRVAIARAILADAPILVLDEATSSLDSITERWIQDALTNLLRDRTAVVIAHRLSTVRRVDRILVFDAGRIVEEGRHDELMRISDGQYRRLVEMQAFGYAEDLDLESRESA